MKETSQNYQHHEKEASFSNNDSPLEIRYASIPTNPINDIEGGGEEEEVSNPLDSAGTI